jgi:uracil-DNA glycosylase family 4
MSMKKKKCQITTCPFTAKTEVKYDGTLSTDVVIVGDSPGKADVNAGIPFAGTPGRILEAVLLSLEYSRQQVLVTNACRCSIDKDHDSIKNTNLAVKTCRPYLETVIKKAKPKVIVTLGAVALQQVLGKKKLLENRGRFFWSEEFKCQVFCTVHPNYVLRGSAPKFWEKPEQQRSMKENLLFTDFSQVKAFLDTGDAKALETIAEDYKEGTKTSLDALFDKKGFDMVVHKHREDRGPRKIVAVDFETTGLNMFDPNIRVLSVSFCATPGQPIVFFADKNGKLPAHVLKVLADPNITKIVASRPFDEVVSKLKLGVEIQGTIHDVLVMAHLIDENYVKYSLETIADAYTPLKGIKSLAEGQRGNLENLPREKLLKYNAVDTDATLRAFNVLKRLIAKDEELARYYAHFILPVLDMFSATYHNGGTISTRQLRKDEAELRELIITLSAEAIAMIPKEIIIEAEGTKKTKKKITLRIPTLLRSFLFTHPRGLRLKAHPQYVTAKNKLPQCTEDHLKQFHHPFIDKLLKIKKAEKIVGTYIKNYWKAIKDEKRRVYPTTVLNGTVTGRTVMREPTIQTIPQRGEFAPYAKRCFVAPKGWLIGARDLGQSEIRIMGWLAKDPNILKALREGIDIHTMTAAIVNKVPLSKVTKDMRQKAKGVNFGFLYGMQAKSFRTFARDEYGLSFTAEECDEVRRAFFAAPNGYYRLPQYHTEQEHIALKQGWVRSPLGRVRHLPGAFSQDFYERGNAARQAINMRIQSFSSDLGLIGMMLFYRKLKEKGYLDRIKPMWFIHDAIMFQTTAKLMPIAMKLLRKCMEEAAVKYIQEKFGVKIGYPVTSDGKVGLSWASMEEWDDEKGMVKTK